MVRAGASDTEVIDLVPVDGDEIPGDVSEQWEEFEKFRDEADSADKGMTVWVYRIPTDARNNPISNTDTRLLFTSPIDAVDSLPALFSRIKKEYMPRGYGVGMFRIMIRQNQGRGVKWMKVYTLEKGALDDDPIPVTDPTAPKSDPAMAIVAAAMDRQTAMIERLMNERGGAQPIVNPMEQTQQMVTMITSIAGILVNRPVAAGGAVPTIAEQISGVREIMKLGKELGGDGLGALGESEEQGLTGILKSVAPIAELLKTMIERAPARPPIAPPRLAGPGVRRAPPASAAPIHGAGGPVNAPGTATGVPHAEKVAANENLAHYMHNRHGDQAMLLKVTEITNDLITLHETQGADPASLGAALVPMIPAEIEDRLLDLLESNNWFEKLCAFNARVKDHRAFFEGVRTAVLAEYESGGEPAEIVPGTTD